MKVLAAVLLALLLCGEPGTGQEQDDDDDVALDDYDDDDDDDEANGIAGAKGRGLLRCFSCPFLQEGERCDQVQSCLLGHGFCKAVLSHGKAESGLLSTYSGWCADACHPVTKTVAETRVAVACCQDALCNGPPWQAGRAQDPPGGGAGGPQGSPAAVGTAVLLGLLPGLRALGS
ncbi:glycosylphosphatidylinositol-anchored high density lipoprotein-binding protein 1 [Dasypus novemcinctus]|uniref:glycosylphosphatidylinositol-anchored high density lipoprotein-binding protein 1 n=1 Tax=Dasypus novemcinctus TaxID=9361 RepID=UPI00265E43DF|nr:glycosylphosphatidylinositol-anchored high density lipoprotein-binding protein 1 [Dasypus novemcinctus]XP_058132283.1 glycosylphosphatidylinositol-anchored high density lipoprotein-binding protein 1 [Dasypus novemcinctus]XP_058132284.1 glycosylphosphatidylinositol-anchored high density lipoprotein-binding protein 1 [Dasypus novemcinctus]